MKSSDDPDATVSSGEPTAATSPAHPLGATPVESPRMGDDDPRLGTHVDRYRIDRRLGAGGMGVVYAAHDPELDRPVALKLLAPRAATRHPDLGQRLQREARALARLAHAHVVAVHDVGVTEGEVFIAMQLIDGPSLDDWLSAAKRTPRAILDVFSAAGRGLAAAHEAGIVHRDFKPSNVLLDKRDHCYVGDFGLALGDDEEHEPGRVMGTPHYMAPEQMRGEAVTARTDQFSFAVSLWDALYGGHPFKRSGGTWTLKSALAAMEQGQIVEPPRGSGVPPRVERALRRALSADPDARWPSIDALVAELAPRSRAPWIWAGASLAGIATAATLSAVYFSSSAPGASCDRAGQLWTGVLDNRARQSIAASFARTDRDYARLASDTTLAELDAWGKKWSSARIDACRATHARGEQPRDVLDRRMACLDADLDRARALVDALQNLTPESAARATVAAADLPAPERCGAAAIGTRSFPGAETPAAAVRRRVEALRARFALGEIAAVRDESKALETEVRALGEPELVATTLYLRGQALAQTDDMAGGVAMLTEAATSAAQARDAELEAQIATRLMDFAARDRNLDRLDAQALMARTAVARAGDPPALRFEVEVGYARGLLQQAEFERARAACGDAEKHAAAAGMAESWRLAYCWCTAETLAQRDPKDALARCQVFHDRVVAQRGADHPIVGDAYYYMAISQRALGDYHAALELQQKELALGEKTHGPDAHVHVYTLSELSGTLVMLHRYGDARAVMERAVAIAERSSPGPTAALARASLDLAQICSYQGDFACARPAAAHALSLAEKALGADHPSMVGTLNTYVNTLYDDPEADYPALLAAARRATAIATTEKNDRQIANGLHGEVKVLRQMKRYREALPIMTRARKLAVTSMQDPGTVALFYQDEGFVLVETGDTRRGSAALASARATLAKLPERTEAVERIDAFAKTHHLTLPR